MSKDEEITPLEISDELERGIQRMNKATSRNFMRGDRTPRDVLIEHYTNIKNLIDEALDLLGSGEPS